MPSLGEAWVEPIPRVGVAVTVGLGVAVGGKGVAVELGVAVGGKGVAVNVGVAGVSALPHAAMSRNTVEINMLSQIFLCFIFISFLSC